MAAFKYFVTGTDTDVGKTVATAQLLRAFTAAGYSTVGMKPVAAGCEWRGGRLFNLDVAAHAAASSIQAPAELVSPYLLQTAISPHIAAIEQDVHIDIKHILAAAASLTEQADVVLVEGAGGWLAPLSNEYSMAELALRLQYPVILVVGMQLGCLNHALLSAQAIANSGLKLAGWIANQVDPQMQRYAENVSYLRSHLPAPLLAEIPFQDNAKDLTLTASAIAQLTCEARA